MKNRLRRIKRTIIMISSFVITLIFNLSFVSAFESPYDMHGSGIPYNMDRIVQKIIYIIVTLFFYIGLIFIITGIGMLVLSFKNEDFEGKSKATLFLIVGMVLMTLNFLWKTLRLWGYTMIERA